MKKIIVILTLLLAISLSTGNISAGLLFGYPSAIIVRYDSSEKAAFDLYLNYNYSYFSITGDYTMKFDWNLENLALKIFFGGGGIIGFHSYKTWSSDWRWVTKTDIYIGIRVKAGVSYYLTDIPLELFIETGPAIFALPSVMIGWAGGAGFRYKF